jgi:chromosome segregation ATPase
MIDITRRNAAIAALLVTALAAAPAAAQQTKGGGKIVCWKDKSGKVVGCGDSIPPEYQQNASREFDKRGMVRGTTVSAAEEAKRKEQEQEQAQKKAEEARRLAEQKRQDQALINTYANEKEIDQRRDRDLQQTDAQISQLQVQLRNATERHNAVRGRHDGAAKSGKPVPEALKDELARTAADKQRAEQNLADKTREKETISARYADQKKRYLELTGRQPAAAPSSATATKK